MDLIISQVNLGVFQAASGHVTHVPSFDDGAKLGVLCYNQNFFSQIYYT
jgi:hypothetical protein